MLEDPPAWYVVGPLLGLIVVGVLATLNQRVGVLGGVSDSASRSGGRCSRCCAAARRSATTTAG